jgi:hypothetical protein
MAGISAVASRCLKVLDELNTVLPATRYRWMHEVSSARFRTWTCTTHALVSTGESSFEYRLLGAPDIRNHILTLIEELLIHVEQGMALRGLYCIHKVLY